MTQHECEAIRPLISAALDGELDEEEFVRLSEHLASCSHCQRVRRDYHRMRDDLRLMSPPSPPSDLAQSVRQQTVDSPPRSTIVRIASRAGMRLGFSSAAAAILIVVIIAVFGFYGYEQRSSPMIASSTPELAQSATWPVNQPVRITFSKRMDQDSVLRNLRIQPSSEQERLPVSWDGNTLVIGASSERTVLLVPDTTYTIFIMPDARDAHGNAIGDFWTLSFRTGPPDYTVANPPEERDPINTQVDPNDRQTDDDGSQEVGDQQTPTIESRADDDEDRDSEAHEPAEESSDQATAHGGNDDQEQSPAQGPESQQDQESDQQEQQSEPTATPEPQPTATPAPDPTPTPTPQPQPTATPTTPAETPTPEPIPVRGAFGNLYWGNEHVSGGLGQALSPEYTVIASEQEFQRGTMYRRFDAQRQSIYVFVDDGSVLIFDDAWTPELGDFGGDSPDEGLYIPRDHFGKIWSENPELAERIGYALTPEARDPFESQIQDFSEGHMIHSRGLIYVVFGDLTWELHPGSTDYHGTPPQSDDEASDGSDDGVQESSEDDEAESIDDSGDRSDDSSLQGAGSSDDAESGGD